MLLLSSSLHAQLASWDFEGEVSTPTTVAPNVTATAAVFGPSVGGISFPSGNSSTDAYSGNNWSTGGIAADRYLEISVEADPCYTLNISGISFDERRSGTGPTSFAVAWSTEDSFTPNTAYAASFGTSIPDNTSWRTQTFMETLSESKVIFRIFGWDAEGTSGTWRFDNIVIDGTAEADATPVVSCSTFTPSFDSRCPDEVSPNVPSGSFGPIPADGIISLGLGFPGSVSYDLDLSTCVSDEESPLGDLEIRLATSTLGTSDGCSQTLTNTYEIRDACGNIASDLVTIEATFEDTEAPTVTCAEFTATFEDCPAGLSPNIPNGNWSPIPASGIFSSAVGGIYIIDVDLNGCVSDNCSDFSGLERTLLDSYAEDFEPNCRITLVNEIGIRDACGNVADEVVIVKITIENPGTTPPAITCPADVTVDCGMPTDPAATGEATATDDCGDPVITFSDSFAPGCGSGTGIITRTWTATGGCDNVSTCEQIITIADNAAPVVTCADFMTTFDGGCEGELNPNVPSGGFGPIPSNGVITVGLGIGTGASYDLDLNGCVSDDCTDGFDGMEISLVASEVEDNDDAGSCGQTLTNTYSIRDACGNVSDDLVTIVANFTDTEAPTVTCAEFTATFEDCPVGLGPNTPSGDWVAIPASGIFSSAVGGIYVIDVDLNGCVSDNCSDLSELERTLVDSYSEDFEPNCRITLVNEIAIRDACGNVADELIVVKITIENPSTTPPAITCPADVTVDCDMSTEPSDTGEATATDDCGTPIITYSDSFVPGCGTGVGVITRTWTATGGCGNVSTCEQIITVAPIAPTIVCPADITIDCTDSTDPGNTGAATGDDSCGSVVTISFSDSFVEDCSPATGTLTRIWTATNACGLSTSCDQIITIIDEMAPVFDLGCQETLTFTTEGGDLCPADATISLSEGDEFTVNDGWTVGGNPISPLSGCLSDDCTADDALTITVDDITIVDDGTCSRTITLTLVADDGCGNVSEPFVSTYTFIDDTAPVFDLACQIDVIFTTEDGNVCPADATISLNEGDVITVNDSWTVGGVLILPLSGCVDDNCTADNDLNITVDDITVVDDGTCSRTITVTFLADDGCDNVSEPFVCNYTFIDNTGPEVSFNGIPDMGTYVVECDLPSGTWDPLIETADLTITDNCSDIDFAAITVELTQLYDGPCVNNLLTRWQQVWVVPDVCGNETTYTLFTEIIDTTPPAFTSVPADLAIECDQPIPGGEAEAFDSCSEVVYNFSEVRTDGDCPYNYTLTRTWTASDGCGNSSTATQTITVEDTTPPEIAFTDEYVSGYTPNQDVYIECSELGNISQIIASAATATDNCSDATPTTYQLEDFGGFDCSEFGYSGHLRSTWTATDECGNTSSVYLNWFLVDETAPVFQGVPEDVCAETLPPVADVQAVDDCEFAVLDFSESDPIDCDGGQYVERTWTATDVCGNTASVTQRITLTDGNGPAISIDYPEIGTVADGDLIRIPVNCDEPYPVSLTTLQDAISIDDGCGGTSSDIELDLMGESDCDQEGYLARYNVSISARDACGNTSTFNLTVDLIDDTPPVVDSPAELSLNCGEEIPMINASDACGQIEDMTFVDSAPITPSCPAAPQAFERIWTITDQCGNSTTFAQSITIIDNAGPVFSGVPADACDDTTLSGEVTAIDECTGEAVDVSLTETTSSETDCGDVLTRTWTATDACGNTTTATQQVFFADDTAPSLSFNHPLLFGLESGDELFLSVGSGLGSPEEPLLFGAADVDVMDNCAADLVATVAIQTELSADCAADGFLAVYKYEWSVTDPCGNTSTLNLIVYYVDTGAPDFFDVPADLEVFCDAVPAPQTPSVSDDYDTMVELSFSEEQTPTDGGLLITRTWAATDDCGNTNTATQEILVADNTLSAEFELSPAIIECNSDDNLLSVIASGGLPPYSYSWELTDPLEDGYITSDPTKPNILFTMGFITQTFTVTITDANRCQLVQSFTVVCDFSGEEGLVGSGNSAAELLVYPNPASDYLLINAAQWTEQPVQVAIYGLLGQEMLRQTVTAWPQEGHQIDTRMLPNGTYLLRLESEGKVPMVREIVVLH